VSKPFAIGIDNGKLGAVSLYRPETNEVWFFTTPTGPGALWRRVKHVKNDNYLKDYRPDQMLDGIKQMIDLAGGVDQLVVAIETPLANTFAKTTRGTSQDNFRGLGIWQTVLSLSGLVPYGVHPTTWKSKMGLLKMDKAYWQDLAQKKFPGVEFETVDQAEATMIACYAARYLK
jgi:hypothetical protein